MQVKDKVDDLLYKVSNPERYIGNEWNQIIKQWQPEMVKVVFSFPDVYEIGMSHLGLKILYHKLNKEEEILCERVFAPWTDMENLLRKNNLPLYSLETGHEIKDFDIFAFTLQYEMSYTNIINMIDLANIPLSASDRKREDPFVIGGGASVFNPEPLYKFFDLFFIGEAEKSIIEIVRKIKEYKTGGLTRKQILRQLSKIPGVYVPSLFEVRYKQNSKIAAINSKSGSKNTVKKQIISNLDQAFHPTDFIVPYMDIVHNRAILELSRGCTRGCRFCAAGITYRPVRERKKETVIKLADKILESTGFKEISLTSLSVVDYTEIEELVKTLANKYKNDKISIALPSLRIDEFSVELATEVQKVRKTGLTFAPEAGTFRLRKVINKGVTEKQLYDAVTAAFKSGWQRIKLYFMIGLPTETRKDLAGIVKMVKKVRQIGRQIIDKRVEINVGISVYVPKPFTPFQWVKMITRKQMKEKHKYLQKEIRGKGLELNWNDPQMSFIEGVFARGDRKLASVLETAWKKGARFDGWGEKFDFSIWKQAFNHNGIKPGMYLEKKEKEEILPWSHLEIGVEKEFLYREYKKAFQEELTSDCRFNDCPACGICNKFNVEPKLSGVVDKC